MTLVYLNVGSNIQRSTHIRAGLYALREQFGALTVSSVYESDAVGFSGNPFFNLAVCLRSDMPLVKLAAWLRQLEYTMGRERAATRFSPRTLDIDILTYGDTIGTVAGVELPRREILENAHVLAPLAELAPAAVHPVAGLSYGELWADFADRHRVARVDFAWRGQRISSAKA